MELLSDSDIELPRYHDYCWQAPKNEPNKAYNTAANSQEATTIAIKTDGKPHTSTD